MCAVRREMCACVLRWRGCRRQEIELRTCTKKSKCGALRHNASAAATPVALDVARRQRLRVIAARWRTLDRARLPCTTQQNKPKPTKFASAEARRERRRRSPEAASCCCCCGRRPRHGGSGVAARRRRRRAAAAAAVVVVGRGAAASAGLVTASARVMQPHRRPLVCTRLREAAPRPTPCAASTGGSRACAARRHSGR